MEWKYDGNKIGTYADDADNSAVLDSAKVYFNGYELGEYKTLKSND